MNTPVRPPGYSRPTKSVARENIPLKVALSRRCLSTACFAKQLRCNNRLTEEQQARTHTVTLGERVCARSNDVTPAQNGRFRRVHSVPRISSESERCAAHVAECNTGCFARCTFLCVLCFPSCKLLLRRVRARVLVAR